MCGNVGIAGKLVYQDEFTMKRMLLADFFRGEHSTGMAAIRANGDAIIAKINSNPIDLFGLSQFKMALNGNTSRVFLGHNRHATRGAINTVNAHPFQFGHIVGAHNGTLDYESFARLKKELEEEFEVDSMAMIAAIAKFGIKKTIELCNEGKDGKEGAWALVWFDQIEGTLNFLRNKHRDLWYAFEEGFERMFWASEWWMIREALHASPNGYTLYTEDEKEKKDVGFFIFEPDVHYKFDVAALVAGSKKRPKPVVTKIKGREKKEVTYSGHVPFESWPRSTGSQTNGTPTGSAMSQKSMTTSTSRYNDKRVVIQLSSMISPYIGMITESDFGLKYTKCQWCNVPMKYGDLGVTFFEQDDMCLCRDCSGYSSHYISPPARVYVSPTVFATLQ